MIRLSCSELVGGITEFTLTKVGDSLEIHGISVGDAGEYAVQRSSQLDKRKPFWWSCAEYMASIESDWAMPENVACRIVVKGCSGIRADVLAICWAHLDVDADISLGKDVLQLTSATLTKLTNQLGSIRKNQFSWLDIFTRIADAMSTLDESTTPPVFLNRALGGSDCDVIRAVSELEDRAGAFTTQMEEEMSLNRAALEAIALRVLGPSPSTGLLAMQSHGEREQKLLYFLASKMIREGVTPESIPIDRASFYGE